MSVAKPLPHDAARLHVTGQARYIDDIPLPSNALHLAFGLSDIAKGQIIAMDLEAVRNAPVSWVSGPHRICPLTPIARPRRMTNRCSPRARSIT